MVDTLKLKKQTIKIMSMFNKFSHTLYFPVIIAIITVVAFVLNIQLLSLLIIVACGCLLFFFADDMAPIMPLFFCFCFSFRDMSIFSNIWLDILIFLPVVAGLVYKFITDRPKKPSGKLYFALIIFCVANLCGGFFSEYMNNYFSGLAISFGFAVGSLLVYFFFDTYLKDIENFDRKKYFAVSLLSACLASGVQFVLVKYGYVLGQPMDYMQCAWWNANFLGFTAILGLYCALYLGVKEGKLIIPLALIILCVVQLLESRSRGALIATIGLTPFVIIILFRFFPKWIKILIAICIIAVIIAAIYVLKYVDLTDTFTKLFYGDDNGRSKLYNDALSLFLKYPVFGGGRASVSIVTASLDNFHSVILHTMATMGTFGLLCHSYFYYKRIAILGAKFTPFNICMLGGFLTYQAYAMIDCGETIFLALYLVVIVVVVEKENRSLPFGKPLYKNNY